MRLVLLICSLAVLRLASAQCGAKLGQAADCMGQFFEQQMQNMPPPPDKEKIHKDIKQCFVSAGCTPPPELDEEEDGSHEGPPPKAMKMILGMMKRMGVTGIDEENMKELIDAGRKCAMDMKDVIKPEMESCIQGKPQLSDFEFPDLFEKLHGDEEGHGPPMMKFFGKGGHGKGGPGGPHMMKKMMHHAKELVGAVLDDEVCPTDGSKKSAQGCIEGVVDNLIPPEHKCSNPVKMLFFAANKHEEFCAKHEECLSNLGNCESVKKQMPRHLCDCGEEYMEDNFDTILNDMKTCVEKETGQSINIPANMVNNALKRFGSKMIRKHCRKEEFGDMNPCDGPPPFLRGHGSHGGSGSHEGGPPFGGPPNGGPPFGGPPEGGPFGPFGGGRGRGGRGRGGGGRGRN